MSEKQEDRVAPNFKLTNSCLSDVLQTYAVPEEIKKMCKFPNIFNIELLCDAHEKSVGCLKIGILTL